MQLDIRNYGTRVAVYFAEGINLTPSNLPDVRYLPYPSRGFSIPAEAAKDLPKWLAEKYPDYRYSISPEIAFRIERELERERNISELATANDGTVPAGILKLEPRELQRAAINYMLHDDANKILALRMGLGKTLVSLWIAERFNLRTLYITKAALVLNVEREIFKLTGKRAVILRGRHPQQEDIAALLDPQFQYFIINYEVIGTEERDPETEKSVWPWIDLFNAVAKLKQLDYTIADEAHACKNTDAQRTRALLRINTPRKLPMSGSPVINRIEELWPMLHWVAPERFSSKASFLNAHTSDGK
jgi:SNF2 family DNA or RNA helicase